MREAIECQAVRIYCGESVKANLGMLTKAAAKVDSSAPGSRENELAEVAFHTALVDLVRSELLSREFKNVMQRRLFYKINAIVPWSQQPALDSHAVLLKKLQRPDPDVASAAMRQHLERGRESILQ
jgi:DNA-binding GntR family transcriptional regulator